MRSPPRERVEFTGVDGVRLRGILHIPAEPAKGAIVLSHCFTCSKDYKVLAWLGRILAEEGYSVLRFDFPGLGESEGDFSRTTLSSNVSDLMRAVEWLGERTTEVRALFGHSLGGAAAILAGRLLPSIELVAVLGTSPDLTGITRLLTPKDWVDLETKGIVTAKMMGRAFPIRKEFVEDLGRHSLLETVRDWKKHFVVFAGTEDRIVDIRAGEELFAAAAQPKAFFAIPGGDHLLGSKPSVHRIARLLDLCLAGGTDD